MATQRAAGGSTGPIVLRPAAAGDFTGRGGALLVVPAGWAAVSRASAQVWLAGSHPVRRHWSGALPPITLTALGPWPLSVGVPGLLAGGSPGELLDADLGLFVAVTEPRPFCEQFGPAPLMVRAPDLAAWLSPRVGRALAPCVRRYLASDLMGGGPAAEKALSAFRPIFAVWLAEVGLGLEWARPLSLTRAADAVLQARQLAELHRGLRQFQNGDKMASPYDRCERPNGRRQPAVRVRGGNSNVDPVTSSSETSAELAQAGFFVRWAAANPHPSRDERRRVARLFQRQLALELDALAARVRPARLAAFRVGRTAQALSLKELERQIAGLADESASVQPAYAGEIVSNLSGALALEDQVLAQARELVAQAGAGGSDQVWSVIGEGVAALRDGLQARVRQS